MAGYRFLMRYYSPGDDIYFFGFSRGAYTARFLAEMLDHVGLLSVSEFGFEIRSCSVTNFSTGGQRRNVPVCMEVSLHEYRLHLVADWGERTFQKWQCRLPDEKSPHHKHGEKSEKQKLLEFMCAFRETFSRPVKPIRFLGLFDTVNSVPAFENAWMQRSKFPYTARSSARVIRHAVSIDERRAKFRQDLISQEKPDKSAYYKRRHKHHHIRDKIHKGHENGADDKTHGEGRGRKSTLAPPERFRNPHDTSGVRSLSPGYSQCEGDHGSAASSILSFDDRPSWQSDEDEGEQDIQEVWFPGCHAV